MAAIQRETEKSRYQGKVMPRLFTYLKPHALVAAACLLLALITTVLDLYRPLLIGDAIDSYIEGYSRPYAYVDAEAAELTYDGLYLSRGEEAGEAERFAVIVYFQERYYLVRDLDAAETEALRAEADQGLPGAEPEDGALRISLNGAELRGELLEKEDLALLRGKDYTGIKRIALLYSLVLVLTVAFGLARIWLLQKMGQDIIFTIREQIFSHVLGLPARYFDTTPVGRIVTRCTNDVESLNEMYTGVLIRLFSNTVLILGYAVVMLLKNPRLAGICFAFLPAIIALTWCFRTLARRVYRKISTKRSELNTFLSENISGMKLIQLFAREERKADEFRERTGDLYRSQMKELYVMAIFRPCIFFVANLALALLVWRSGLDVIAGSLTLGTMYVFINYIRNFFEPIQEMAEHFSTLQSASAAAEKIFSVLDEENPIREPEQPVRLERVQGRIEFRHVWFAYEGEDYVLRDLSFVIEPGQRVAFVGATGAGKSSILNLIGRYYDIQKGSILIDGVDIRQLSTREIRRAVGQVQQDVFLFTGDIKSNIRLLDESITDAQIRAAAKAVNADRFIEALPQGYDEPVMERGSTLSAGQRQLLSFARTVIHRPEVMILDEATANIDTETELLIQDSLSRMRNIGTMLIVAHRLSTIQHADNIIVLSRGQIVEQGNHQELLKQKGSYHRLYMLQYNKEQLLQG